MANGFLSLTIQTTMMKQNRDPNGNQGPVVQSVVNLTSSLRVISFTILADSIYNILIFFAEKMWVAFALQKLLTFFFSKKFQHICVSLDLNFNESLTNDVVSFEQLGTEGCVKRATSRSMLFCSKTWLDTQFDPCPAARICHAFAISAEPDQLASK